MNLLEVKVDVVNYELDHLNFVLRLHILQFRINLLQLELRREEVSVRNVMYLSSQFPLVLQKMLYPLFVVYLLDS